MTLDAFWELIAQSRRNDENECEQADNLTTLLKTLSPQEITEFDRLFCDCLQRLYRHDVVGVHSRIWGGMSDDTFLYFRAWITGQGRAYYESTLADVNNSALNVIDKESDGWGEALLTCALIAYEEKTDEEFEGVDYDSPGQLQGERPDEQPPNSML